MNAHDYSLIIAELAVQVSALDVAPGPAQAGRNRACNDLLAAKSKLQTIARAEEAAKKGQAA